MDKVVESGNVDKEYATQRAVDPGPLVDSRVSGTWKDYIAVTKVGIILGNLLTVIAAMWLAAGGRAGFFQLDLSLILLTLAGSSLIIASGTTINNFVDRDIDRIMERTKYKRPLATGRLEPNKALIFGVVLGLIGTVLLLAVNIVATVCALIGLFVYVVLYTLWLKRSHHINTIVGGISGAMPPVIGWTAVTGAFDTGALVFFVFLFIWQPPHFLALAMRRCSDYRDAGIPMLPVVKGMQATKQQIVIWVAALIPASLYLYLVSVLNLVYVIVALVLGITWLVVSLGGFNTKDDISWAKSNFKFSLIYLTVISLTIVVTTL